MPGAEAKHPELKPIIDEDLQHRMPSIDIWRAGLRAELWPKVNQPTPLEVLKARSIGRGVLDSIETAPSNERISEGETTAAGLVQ